VSLARVVEHIVFDFFGTLVSYSDGVRGNPSARALTELASLGASVGAERFESMFAGCFEALEADARSSHEEYSMAAAAGLLFDRLGLEADAVAIERFIAAYLEDWNEGVAAVPRLGPWLSSLPHSKSVLTNTHQPDTHTVVERFVIAEKTKLGNNPAQLLRYC